MKDYKDCRYHYGKGVELYNKTLFKAADFEFERAISLSGNSSGIIVAEAEAYRVLIAIELRRVNLDAEVHNFENQYPYSSQLETVRLKYASYNFDLGHYDRALEILNRIQEKNLTESQKTEYDFKLGYTLMSSGNFTRALSLFDKVYRGRYTTYTNAAGYYIGYIQYTRNNFNKAVEMFASIEKDPRFTTLANFYTLECNFMLRKYDEVIEKGENLYSTFTGEFRTKCARMLSEAFFASGNTEKAKYYFERYSLTTGELSRRDIYYKGTISFRLKNFRTAAESFTQVLSIDDSLSQNASYHLGYCFTEMKNKQQALLSFKKASEQKWDQLIKEDAMFNYAKLSFDLNSDITKFQQYLSTYSPPDSKYNEIQNYIASFYLITRDYKSAVEALSLIRQPLEKDILNLQKASFLRGLELIDLGSYRDAAAYLKQSDDNSKFDNKLGDLARFWLAEALYRDNQFQNSVNINLGLVMNGQSFKKTSQYPLALYNLAYGYFKLADFQKAQEWFGKFVSSPGGGAEYLTEARLRLGDCHFMQRDYSGAVDIYSQAANHDPLSNAYAKYQMAISYGLLGEDQKKIEILEDVVKSPTRNRYYPEVLYELGRTLVQNGKNSRAMECFTELSEDFRESNYYTKSLLEMGLISFNQQETEKAIQFYKKILEESPMSQEAQNALAGLENIYTERGEAEVYLAYLEQLGISSAKTPDERELMIFNSAEKHFLSGNYPSAVSSLTSYISKHPEGSKITQAYYYLGESLQKTGKPEQAMDAYMKVMERGAGSFSELATLNYARISYSLEDYQEALKGYSTLGMIAVLENNKIESQMGKLNSFFMLRQYENALAEAGRASNMPLSEQDKERVKFIKAKSYYLLGERGKALPLLKELAKNKMTPLGAESEYLIISNYFDNGDFSSVEKEVFAFSDSGTPHTYWLAKSYILLGDSYAERSNWEQAEATFRSIQESYKSSGKDDIAEQIKMRLEKIKNRE
jgi:tetratricopeptide (TPR) repeat protein